MEDARVREVLCLSEEILATGSCRLRIKFFIETPKTTHILADILQSDTLVALSTFGMIKDRKHFNRILVVEWDN